jgi:lipopolysaccharide/colanic/teichoic acid biosynthesis glycosyltransferase
MKAGANKSMIRIRGFARKTRRLTKGGSSPESLRDMTSSESQHLDRTSEPSSTMGNNGHHSNGNGAKPHHLNGSERVSNSQARSASGDNGITSFLHKAVARLVPSERSSSPSGTNGNSPVAPIETVSALQTIFARTSEVDSEHLESRSMPRWKRILDLTCIVLSAPIWIPLLLLVMAWIRVVSPGPIFYRQERVGYRRSRFMIFKFRTMHANAETRSHEEYFAQLMKLDCPMTKLDAIDDSRLIRCGRLLRASGLDELPQIFNVLSGEMSLVGPRPCLPNEFERYQPSQQERVNAPPGLTGYWQVNGKNKTTFSEMIAMDIFYAEHMSPWLDFQIILRTIPALIGQTIESRGRGSADTVAPELSGDALNASARKI